MSAVANLEHNRGETISFGLRATPDYDGTEIVTCDIKAAVNGSDVPPDNAPVVASITPTFVPADGETRAYWSFIISAEQSSELAAGRYITDAKITYPDGVVDRADPLGITLSGRVTA